MAMPSRIGPIYNIIISSPEDIERAFNHNAQDKQRISKILNSRYSPFTLERAVTQIDVAPLYKEIYFKSLGFAVCQEVLKRIDSYRVSLKNSLVVCKDILTPLFMRSFECHQMTIPYYAMENPQDKAAITHMVEIGQIATAIEGEYTKLEQEFKLLAKEDEKTSRNLGNGLCKSSATLRNLKEDSITDSLRKPILEEGNSFSISAIKTLIDLNMNMLNVKGFWNCAGSHAETLADPDLAKPSRIRILQSMKPGEPDNFISFLLRSEKVLDAIIPLPEKEKSLTEVVASMKTGHGMSKTEVPCEGGIVQMLQSTISRGIEAEFEKSYLNWVALAKVNQTMVNALTKAIIEIEKIQGEILKIEKDPLAIALHETSIGLL